MIYTWLAQLQKIFGAVRSDESYMRWKRKELQERGKWEQRKKCQEKKNQATLNHSADHEELPAWKW